VDQQPEISLFLSVLTIAELEKGILLLEKSSKRDRLEDWLQADLLNRFTGRILNVDMNVVNTWARLQADAEKKGHRLPTMDSLIAATAMTHDFTLVSRNTRDFVRSGARLFDPWREG
jgi:predicted nucleic acid-binding protein